MENVYHMYYITKSHIFQSIGCHVKDARVGVTMMCDKEKKKYGVAKANGSPDE